MTSGEAPFNRENRWMSSLALDVDQSLQQAIDPINLESACNRYWEQNEFLLLERFVPANLLDDLLLDVEELRSDINRNYVPVHKKGGSVSYYAIRKKGSTILGLYRSDALRQFFSRLTKTELLRCPENDPHACALYFYTEPGDHIGFHYDTSYYKGNRYTVLIGLVERSEQCRLVARLYQNDPPREIREIRIPMAPGTAVVFNGDKLWHAVTPLEKGAERIILTLQYVTDQTMGPFKKMFSNMKDAFAYFGPAALMRQKSFR